MWPSQIAYGWDISWKLKRIRRNRRFNRSDKQAKMQVSRKYIRHLSNKCLHVICMCFVNCTLTPTTTPAALCPHLVLDADVQGNSLALKSPTVLRAASGSSQVQCHAGQLYAIPLTHIVIFWLQAAVAPPPTLNTPWEPALWSDVLFL